MRNLRFERRLGPPEARTQVRSVLPSWAVSLGLHALLIGALIWAPLTGTPPRLPPGAISVNLVSMPAPGPAAGGGEGGAPVEKPKPPEAPKPAVEKPAVSIAEPVPPPKAAAEPPKAEVSLAPVVKEKKSLKAQTKDNQKLIERAIDRIEKKVAEPDTSSVTAAIDRLRRKLGEAETERRPGPPGPGSAPAAGGGGSGPGGGGGGGGGPGQIQPIDIYRVSIAQQVEKNWAFSPQLAGSDKNLTVGLVFKVMPNGEITDVRYTQRSNNAYLDESAFKAILKSNPVAGHPAMIRAPYVEVAIRFTPEGLR